MEYPFFAQYTLATLFCTIFSFQNFKMQKNGDVLKVWKRENFFSNGKLRSLELLPQLGSKKKFRLRNFQITKGGYRILNLEIWNI